ncbi:MAG: PD40 domain-containing protein [Victivallales bacterium]|nr:PD40 domain-containing protein [Victivallales bacterium]
MCPRFIASCRVPLGLVFSAALVTLSLSCNVFAQNISVRKAAQAQNPTLFFAGVAGSAEMSRQVEKDLTNCGWFDLVRDSAADYAVRGQLSAQVLEIELLRGGAAVQKLRVNVAPSAMEAASRQAVDAMLKRLFDVEKLCTSVIAFCARTRPGAKEIFIADYDGSNVRQATRNATLSVEPDWGPGQKRLVYTVYGKASTNVVEYDVSSSRSRRLLSFPGLNAGAAVSPDGRFLAAILSKDGSVDLYLKSLEGAWMRRLTDDIASESSPCWSPTGGRICYVSDISGRPQLYVVNAAGGRPTRLGTMGTEAVSPDWSADNKIIYSAKMGASYALALLDLEGKIPPRAVIQAAGDWESPSWAPDNRHVVATRTFDGRSDIYVIDTWTGKARRILAGKIPFSMPAW